MAGLSIAAVADDLTGAAEIAAIGHRHGLQARIRTQGVGQPTEPGLTVFDTDSRLLPASEAALRLKTLGACLLEGRSRLTFKKTDSVLRGNVAGEITAVAGALGLRRVLLVPANPSLGRTTRSGNYYINGVPLHETAFARDPHHPARTASIRALLGETFQIPLTVLKPGDPFPDEGIVFGETATPADVAHWAGRLDAETLPAGGAEFFEACLKQLGLAPSIRTAPSVGGTALVITGALTPARQELQNHARTAGWPCLPMPGILASHDDAGALENWMQRLEFLLARHRLALTASPSIALDDHSAAERIRRTFGLLAVQPSLAGSIKHLVVEGGATAAAISGAAGWSAFDVVGSWAGGVISLRSVSPGAPVFTIKPGSYAWPGSLWQQLDSQLIPNAQCRTPHD